MLMNSTSSSAGIISRNNPEKRVSQSEYMIFGFYGLSPEEQKRYLTDIEATRLMRPYNNESEKYLKDKFGRKNKK